MKDKTKVVQKIFYPAFVNQLAELTEVIVPDLGIHVAATELKNVVGIAKFLVQSRIDALYAEHKETPPPRILSRSEILDVYKYGQKLIDIEAEVECYL